MKTYFIRHTYKLRISEETLTRLHSEGLVAIHYPNFPEGLADSDNPTLDPSTHDIRGRNILRRFLAFGLAGGYVCAEYHGIPGWLVGFVEPGTGVSQTEGEWRDIPGRVAILKTVRLGRFRQVTSGGAAAMLVARPRQGTFMQWHRAGTSVERLVNGTTATATFDDLSPDQQEMMCAEFLRSDEARKLNPDIPRLAHLILPTGRTMRDIDFIGVATDSRRLVAQVTYSTPESVPQKVSALLPYAVDAHVLLFCDTRHYARIGQIHLIPVREVFDTFTKGPFGSRWLELATTDKS